MIGKDGNQFQASRDQLDPQSTPSSGGAWENTQSFGRSDLIEKSFGQFSLELAELVRAEFGNEDAVAVVMADQAVSSAEREGKVMRWADMVQAIEAIETSTAELFWSPVEEYESAATQRAASYVDELTQSLESVGAETLSVGELQRWIDTSAFVSSEGLNPQGICELLANFGCISEAFDWKHEINVKEAMIDLDLLECKFPVEKLVDLPGAFSDMQASPLRIETNQSQDEFLEKVRALLYRS
jgi:hypothetical protein